MPIDERILNRLDALIEKGDRVLGTRSSPPSNVIAPDRVERQLAAEWSTNVKNILIRVFGEESPHFRDAVNAVEEGLTFAACERVQGILRAAKDDYTSDSIFSLRSLVTAEVLDTMMDQAEELLANGYYGAAAVVLGSYLESGLRSLCRQHGIDVQKPTMEKMNIELAKAGVYSKLVQKRVTALGEIRNNAAHGYWTNFAAEDVNDFFDYVKRFLADHLG